MNLSPVPPSIAECFSYDPESGVVVRTLSRRGDVHREMRGKNANGYITLWFDGIVYSAHRVAWFLHYGEDAKGWIDHVNGDRRDNRISNLRIASPVENARNMTAKGPLAKGVYFHSRAAKFASMIRADGKRLWLGYFDSEQEASAAYQAASGKYHGTFARLG